MVAAAFSASASVGAPVQMLVGAITPLEDPHSLEVEIVTVNGGGTDFIMPDRLSALLSDGVAPRPVVLERTGKEAAGTNAVQPGGFGRSTYRLEVPDQLAGPAITLSFFGESAPRYAIDLTPPATVGSSPSLTPQPQPRFVSTKPEGGNAFLANLSAYAPIYAVYGPGTNSDARLQISFKYQFFGTPGAVGRGQPWENGIHFAYTQRMFWNLGPESSPFRSVDFMPELFYLVPEARVSDRLSLGGQFGFRHESNGRAGIDSRSLNMLYVQPVATVQLGDYTLTAGPRLWIYTGSLKDNPDVKRYRGNTGLMFEIGADEGFRLTTTSRLNPGRGNGAIDAELSYPLDKIIDTKLNLYVFGQAFAGYGENLLDYNRSTRRLRIGIGIVR
ncbi:MAG: phospholipase [Sphingomonadales bacterium]|nr:MAG: phospholipase [Sphingomonadales bacterium]